MYTNRQPQPIAKARSYTPERYAESYLYKVEHQTRFYPFT